MARVAQERIRNFAIISHIDHGKSTLADRFLEICGLLEPGKHPEQFLDRMDLERERGITIKAQAVRMTYRAGGEEYQLNLVDTPGHVDFSYEVSRALAACEGAVLLVDASQGVEAQTLANLYLALESELVLVPAVNKIDLPQANPERVAEEVARLLGVEARSVLAISAKTGAGVPQLLEAVVERVPPPSGDPAAPPRALVFDSTYDPYRGVVCFVRVVDGELRAGDEVLAMATGARTELLEVGYLSPDPVPTGVLAAGEVGYLITGIKDVGLAKVGDTLTSARRPAARPLPGYRDPKPMVFAGIYPADESDFEDLRDALARLKLSDASLVFEPETSKALGFGFRCGFLGLLHMDIVKERLQREHGLSVVATSPSVAYKAVMKDGREILVRNPADLPSPGHYDHLEEPVVEAVLVTPASFLGAVMELSRERRAELKGMEWLSEERVELRYRLPLAEVITDFHDVLKSKTRGYASFDYEFSGYAPADLVRVDILVHGERADAFSAVVPREEAQSYGRAMARRLKELIPRQLFDVAIQAAVGSRIVARETIPARRKDVLAKCYGGDVTRKRKLLEKQKEGKKKLKMLGKVEVPPEAFVAALGLDRRK